MSQQMWNQAAEQICRSYRTCLGSSVVFIRIHRQEKGGLRRWQRRGGALQMQIHATASEEEVEAEESHHLPAFTNYVKPY
jgi:hypothetical protein